MEQRLQQLIDTTWEYYRQHARDMPWRADPSPYKVVVSELMLQQTQVSRVIPKFTQFTQELPDFAHLAKASRSQLLGLWQGLGYNRRALALQEIARRVESDLGGQLPSDPAKLQQFPGIGPGTAGSIAAFAFNQPTVFIETNIRRVFIHHLFPKEEAVTDKQLLPYIEKALDQEHPREWYYALMDYGSYLVTQTPNPNRRSHHHSIQSRFEGSDRQIRGAILRLLLEHNQIKVDRLPELLDAADTQRVQKIVSSLVKDGIIIQKSDKTLKLE